MTVPTTIREVTHPGDGTQEIFGFPFEVIRAEHLIVTLILNDASEVVQTLGVDYNIIGVNVPTGGNVDMTNPPDADQSLRLERDPELTQPTSLRNTGTFTPENVETALDRLLMQIQAVEALADDDDLDEDAIHDNVADEINQVTLKGSPVGADIVLIEDSAEGPWDKKKVALSTLLGGATDPDAVHLSVADEFDGLDEVAAAETDRLIIEDASDLFNKKRITLTDLLGGGGGGEPQLTTYTDGSKPAANLANNGIVFKQRDDPAPEKVVVIYQKKTGEYDYGTIWQSFS